MDNLHKRADIYAEEVQKAFSKTVNKILALYKSVPDVNIAEGVMFSFDDDIKNRKAQVERLIRELHSVVVVAVDNGIELEWDKANENLDNAIFDLFPEVDQKSMPAWFERNNSAMKAFTQRVISGMTLSDRVWKTVTQLRHELEVAMTIAIGQGKSASRMSRDVRQYLKDPDLMFRRFRYKKGETEEGQPIWGRKWKKRIIDPATGKFKFIDYDRDSYPSGRGVYKSAAKNAMRIARTETNMAYRMADNDRWGRLPFVLGQRIQLSHSHPHYDICDELAGVYPKSFVFVGWHPQCFCFSTPVLVSENEILKANKAFAKGEKYTPKGKDVTEMPKAFDKWVKNNKDKIILSRKKDKEPYFLKYNKGIVDKALGIKSKGKRTPEQVADIKARWAERKDTYDKITRMSNNVLKVAKEYPEIDVTDLRNYIDMYSIYKMDKEARIVAKKIVEIRKDEKALSVLIPDVHEWKKQFTSAELHEVYDAVEKKIASWSSLSLEKQAEKLKFEWDDFLGGNMKNVQLKYKTWQVSQAAYKRKYEQVLDSIDWQNIDNVLQEALTFKTKSKKYLDLIDELQVSISTGDKTKAQSIVADMQAKRAELKRAADARAVKRYGKSADGLYAGGNPFEAGELAKLKDYETRIIDGIMSGRGADHNLIAQYHDYVLQLSEKYYPKQASLFTDEERNAMKAIADKYLARPKTNPHWIWGTDLGGVYSGIDSKVNAYLPKLAGLTREELSIVQRFTNGSTFSNCYNLRNESEYWRNEFKDKLSLLSRAEIKEQYEIIEEWSQGANYTLDRMVRYNGITFRGLNSGGGPELRKTLSQAFKKNKPWVNNASCSTSMKHRVAESFDGDTILIIHNKTGAYIHAISDYSKEYEIMTLRGTKYKVLAPPKRIGSRYYVELEEII